MDLISFVLGAVFLQQPSVEPSMDAKPPVVSVSTNAASNGEIPGGSTICIPYLQKA
jgi:hypothetical protein